MERIFSMIQYRHIFVEGKENRTWAFAKERYEGHEVFVENQKNMGSFVLKQR